MSKKTNHSYFHYLKKKWQKKHKKIEKEIIANHGHLISALVPRQQIIGGLMLAAVPFMQLAPTTALAKLGNLGQQEQSHISLIEFSNELKKLLPDHVRPLIPGEEKIIENYLFKVFNFKASAELNGIRLNRSYGFIGKEQHLKRFPGDNIYGHFSSEKEFNTYSKEGVAPGLGAWGYFANSEQEMTEKDILREKYYIAVPTFLAPEFNEHVGEYGLFFKYRKMFVVNPENGKAIVSDIADAGPAEWTKKHLGGSPEVMDYLERVDGAQKGPVLYFFIDDSNDTIPLGPINP